MSAWGGPPPSARPSWLFVLPWSADAVGGVSQVVRNLATQMQERGRYRPLLMVIDWSATQLSWSCDGGITVVRRRIRPRGTSLSERLRHKLWEIGFSREFQAFCREHEVAVINPHYVGAASLSLYGVVANFPQPIPVLFSLHGADLTDIEASPAALHDWRLALQAPHCAAVACSQALGQRVEHALGTTPQVILNGVDMDALLRDAPALPAGRRQRTILSIGRFETKKGQDILLQAFAKIHAHFEDVGLQFVGAEDRALPSLQALARDLHIASRVHFALDVPHEQISKYLAEADVFALPSRQEPFGLVLLEAAAFRLPVIASRTGGIPEIICDGETGVLVEVDDVNALAEGLAALLSAPQEAAAMGARLHEDARARFSWQRTAQGYDDLLTALA